MTPKYRSIAIPMAALLAVCSHADRLLAQQSASPASRARMLVGEIDRELKKVDAEIGQREQYIAASNARLNQMAPEVIRYDELFNQYEARQNQLYAQGRIDEGNAIADEFNSVHLPRWRSISTAFLQQVDHYEQVAKRLDALKARRSELASYRGRIQLSNSPTAERLAAVGGSEEGISRAFDANGRGGKSVPKSNVPPVGPAGPVNPPPSSRR